MIARQKKIESEGKTYSHFFRRPGFFLGFENLKSVKSALVFTMQGSLVII